MRVSPVLAWLVLAATSFAASPVRVILDTDMSGDCDDAGALAVLHALADRGECEILATIINRKDLANASAAAVSAVNAWYGRAAIPIGTDKAGPTALQRTSPFTPALRDGFPHDAKPDDEMPDALDISRTVLAAQPDGSVTICGVGAFSNLAELCRRETRHRPTRCGGHRWAARPRRPGLHPGGLGRQDRGVDDRSAG